jgi:hypothetical protein
MNPRFQAPLALLLLTLPAFALPVIDPATLGLVEQVERGPRVKLSIEQLSACVVEEGGKLWLDLARADTLLDGRPLDAGAVAGSVCAGPWPFEAEESGYSYRRFRLERRVEGGRAELPLKGLFNRNLNSEGWTDTGSALVRVELVQVRPGQDEHLVLADIPVRFRKEGETLRRLPALLEGPLLCKVDSRSPGTATVALKTDLPCSVALELDNGLCVQAMGEGRAHEIALHSLPTDPDPRYRVRLDGEPATEWLDLPLPGPGPESIVFAYCGDSRDEDGGGDRGYLGVNLHALEPLLGLAYTQGAQALLFGGDLISGYTIHPDDFRAQLQAFKQVASGWWRERPLFAGIGNHETLLRIFRGDKVDWLGMDRWPYATESAEAVFARELCNPDNGPLQQDPDLPGYAETVFSTRLGCVTAIFLNNVWWYNEHEELTGGNPQGYMLDDQLRWLQAQVAAADADPACSHIVVVAHEPVFPQGGHVKDSMWHGGDNTVRAWKAGADGVLAPMGPGVIEVRNRLVEILASSDKTAAVLAGHEHAYAKLLLTPETAAGDPARDDPDGDGRLCEEGEPCSPVPGLRRPLWFLTSGSASPWYAQEPTPWAAWWQDRPGGERGCSFTSQESVLLFDATPERIGLRVLNPFGEELDRIEDLRSRGE